MKKTGSADPGAHRYRIIRLFFSFVFFNVATTSAIAGADPRFDVLRAEVEGATFTDAETGAVEVHGNFRVDADHTVRLTARRCMSRDGVAADANRCGSARQWTTVHASFVLRDLDTASIAVHSADGVSEAGSFAVIAECWNHAANCIRWTAPGTDQKTIRIACNRQAGCRTLIDALQALIHEHHWQLVADAGGFESFTNRIGEYGYGHLRFTAEPVALRRGGRITFGQPTNLLVEESVCEPRDSIHSKADQVLAICAKDPGRWTNRMSVIRFEDIDPDAIDFLADASDGTRYAVSLACLRDRDRCIWQQSTGATPGNRSVSRTSLLCRDDGSCRKMAADLLTLVMLRRDIKAG